MSCDRTNSTMLIYNIIDSNAKYGVHMAVHCMMCYYDNPFNHAPVALLPMYHTRPACNGL